LSKTWGVRQKPEKAEKRRDGLYLPAEKQKRSTLGDMYTRKKNQWENESRTEGNDVDGKKREFGAKYESQR